MSDTSYPVFQHYGTNAQRLAFTPAPAGGQPIYLWYETDTGQTFLYDTSWHQITSAGTLPASVQGDIFYATAVNTVAALAKNTTATRYLSNTGGSNNPAWAQVAIGNGVSGLGTGVATALAVNVGTAGATVVNGGALGTPSSGTLTNCTGLPTTGLGAGAVVQVVNTITGAVATGTTTMPFDDTIPQNTEGDEYMTLAITPKNSANKLKIEVIAQITVSLSGQWLAGALFQDSTAGALAAGWAWSGTNNTAASGIVFTHYMTAGTTSATTFKFRAGRSSNGTVTFNGAAGGRELGGIASSSITITEIAA